LWKRVLSSRAVVVVHDESHSQGGTQVITRQVMGPMHDRSWLHWPYRNLTQHDLRNPQLLLAHPHEQSTQASEQVPEPPQPQLQEAALQSR
jgi:hypothetical protein